MSEILHQNDPDHEAVRLDKEEEIPCQKCQKTLIIGFLSTTGIALCEFCGGLNDLKRLLEKL